MSLYEDWAMTRPRTGSLPRAMHNCRRPTCRGTGCFSAAAAPDSRSILATTIEHLRRLALDQRGLQLRPTIEHLAVRLKRPMLRNTSKAMISPAGRGEIP